MGKKDKKEIAEFIASFLLDRTGNDFLTSGKQKEKFQKY